MRLRTKWTLPNHYREDATAAGILEKQFTSIDREVQLIEFAALKARNFIPIDKRIDSWAQFFEYYEGEFTGEAVFVSPTTNTMPRVEQKFTQRVVKMYTIGLSYGYDAVTLQRCLATGTNLDDMKARACREATERKIDEILALGDTARGILGLINRTDTVTYATPNGASAAPQWRTKTALEIVRDVAGMESALKANTQGNAMPTTLILPDNAYAHISSTVLDGTSVTVKKFVRDSFDTIKKIEPWSRLNAAGSGSSGRAILYEQTEDVLSAAIPQEYQALDAQADGLDIVIPTYAIVGGTICRKPGWICYADNVS